MEKETEQPQVEQKQNPEPVIEELLKLTSLEKLSTEQLEKVKKLSNSINDFYSSKETVGEEPVKELLEKERPVLTPEEVRELLKKGKELAKAFREQYDSSRAVTPEEMRQIYY
jgi:hypothetical protein